MSRRGSRWGGGAARGSVPAAPAWLPGAAVLGAEDKPPFCRSAGSPGARANAGSKVMLFSHLHDGPGAASPPPTGAPTFRSRASRKAPTAPHPSVCTAPRREQVRLRDLRPGCRISHTKVDDPYEAGYPAMTGLRPGMRQVSKGLFLFKQRPFPPRRWFGFRDLWPQPCGGHKAPTSTEAVTPATSRRFSRRASGRHSLLPKTIPTRPQLPFCVPSS